MPSLAPITKSQIARFPEVTAWVLSDVSGALVESSGDVDGEAAGAVYAIAARSLNAIGEQLGIGAIRHASLTGPGLACVLTVQDQEVLGIYVDPAKPLGAFEKKLDGILHR